jgi:hypothetical protein
MKKSIRLLVLACATTLPLAVVALAAASYTPSMGIFQSTYKPGAASPVTIVLAQEKADDPTAQIVTYVGRSYTVTLGQPAGATIGTVVAGVQVLDLSPNRLELNGPVKAEDPAGFVSNQCSPGVHEAVWTLNAALPGQPANPIPVYVDHTTGAEAAFSSAKITTCFRDPMLPPSDPRRAPNGTKFLDASFTVKGVFKNPSVAGNTTWRSVFTPYRPGTGTPNPTGTREAQGLVPVPYSVSVKRIKTRRGFFRLAGTVNVAGTAPINTRLLLLSGIGRRGTLTLKAVASTRTVRGGKYAFSRRLPKQVTYFFVERPPSLSTCSTSPIGVPCTASLVSNTLSKVVKVAPAPKRKRA